MNELKDFKNDIRKLAPILGEDNVPKIEAAYLLSDELSKQRIVETIDAIKASILLKEEFKDTILMEPPSEKIALDGKIEIGTVLYGKDGLYSFLMKKNQLLNHIGIFGSSGSGKTNIIQWLSFVLAKNDIPLVIFDFSKRNYRTLLEIPELKKKIRIFTIGRSVSPFSFNPLRPPEGIQVSQWIKEFAEVFDHAYWLLGGGRHLILKCLDVVYKKLEPNYPKLSDLKRALSEYSHKTNSSREKNWLSTAQRPLESLCMRETGDVFKTDKGILPSELFEKGKITILELDSLSAGDKTFFIEIMLQWIRDWLLVGGTREKVVGVIALEEAHHVLNREKSRMGGIETVMDLTFREMRELGIGIIYVDQHPSLISYPALGNTSTHVYLNLGLDTKHSSDVMDAAHMLGLQNTEEVDYIRRLPIGEGFILSRRSEFRRPFLIKFPRVMEKVGVISDEDVKKAMHEVIVEEIKKGRINQTQDKPKKDDVLSDEEKIKKIINALDSSSWKIIKVLGKGKANYTSEIYGLLGMSGTTFRKKAEELMNKGFIARIKAKTHKQNAYYYFLTKLGELTFNSKYDWDKKDTVDLKTMKYAVRDFYSSKGWELIEDKGSMRFEKDGNTINVCLETESNLSIDGLNVNEELHFVCSSEKVSNKIIQSLARFSFDNGICFRVFTGVLEDLKNGDLKEFEFLAEV